MATPATALQKTPLHAEHLAMGARMVDFGGWDMPVQYSSIVEEHHAVRRSAGLFDVSHMGEIEVRGARAIEFVNYATTNDARKLAVGQAQYSGLLYEHGGFVDDILVHKVAEDHYFLCVNASNQEKDFEHLLSLPHPDCVVENTGDKYAQLAIQGPKAEAMLQPLTPAALSAIGYYHFVDSTVSGVPARIARTGYTGEDGFEIYFAPDAAVKLWRELVAAGAKPCGLGARNTLRLEAKMALYGHEIGPTVSPLAAGLGWIVKWDKGDFVGRAALEKQKQAGVGVKLVGFEMVGRGIGRDGYEVFADAEGAGWVTSGGPSPTLGKNIGLCLLPADRALVGKAIQILIRGQLVDARVVATPFYQRNKGVS